MPLAIEQTYPAKVGRISPSDLFPPRFVVTFRASLVPPLAYHAMKSAQAVADGDYSEAVNLERAAIALAAETIPTGTHGRAELESVRFTTLETLIHVARSVASTRAFQTHKDRPHLLDLIKALEDGTKHRPAEYD